MCFLHLTHPSGAVGSRLCGARGAVGGSVPCLRVSATLNFLLMLLAKLLACVCMLMCCLCVFIKLVHVL